MLLQAISILISHLEKYKDTTPFPKAGNFGITALDAMNIADKNIGSTIQNKEGSGIKILVIRFSSIGDIVLATPVFRCLKQQLAGVTVHFLTKRSFRAVTEANPYIDKFFYYDDNLSELVSQLQEEEYTYVVDLHKNFRSRYVRLRLGVKALVFKKLSWQKLLLTKLHIDLMPKRHITDRSLDTLSPLGVVNDGMGLDYFIPVTEQVDLSSLPETFREGFIALVIGASYATKKLPLGKLVGLCKILPYPVVLVGGKEDAAIGQLIEAALPQKVYSACGHYNLHGSADLVKHARLVISHDTGLQYIACALQKPVLAIWGATSPRLAVAPYYGNKIRPDSLPVYQDFLVDGLTCQPCSNFGTRTCPRGHFKCMKEQDLEAIADMAKTYWGNP